MGCRWRGGYFIFNPLVLSEKVGHQKGKMQYQHVQKRKFVSGYREEEVKITMELCFHSWMDEEIFQREVRLEQRPSG